MRFLSRFLRRAAPSPVPPLDVPRRVYAVGDLHGRLDLLDAMIDRIAADLRDRPAEGASVVFLGDYVDRGPDAAGVLARLHALDGTLHGARVVTLMGNHERMMLDFLDAPIQAGRYWMRYGGRDTLRSFDVADPGIEPSPRTLAAAHEGLLDALAPDMRHWLAALPLWWREGNLVCVHAALEPDVPLDGQDERALLWSPPPEAPRTDGLWVAHGHVVVPEAGTAGGRIALDTGAWETGRLTAGVVEEDVWHALVVDPGVPE